MPENNSTGKFSRRKFVKGFGATVAGAVVLNPSIPKITKSLQKKIKISEKIKLNFNLNGKNVSTDIYPYNTLLEVLRKNMRLTGTKKTCNNGECGGCTVIINKQAIYSCHILAMDIEGKDVLTIEGIGDMHAGEVIRKAFKDMDGLQCGFCTPGQVMSAYALLLNNKKPSLDEIKTAMSGNLCRCGAYHNISASVIEASNKL
ncbi:MAG: (2Fe-2S)-binding protein [Bacteroidota bacterium]|nr:(2Fe-2S)-binding protein [Bacteroidota bacterium]